MTACKWLVVLLGLVVMGTGGFAVADEAKLGPPEKLDALRARLGEDYPFVVRFAEGAANDPARLGPTARDHRRVEVVNAVVATMNVEHALALADEADVAQVWYVHPDDRVLTFNTLLRIDQIVRELEPPAVVNLSLGPRAADWPRTPYRDHPVTAATWAAASRGFVVVVAVGNAGRPDGGADGYVNPWCYGAWTLCVGAWDGFRAALADFSARGDPADPSTWPDLVADGVDVVGPWPPGREKSAARRARDEGSAHFRANVPAEKWAIYTLESGTSQAAANVSGAVAQILHFVRSMLAEEGGPRVTGRPLFQLTMPAERWNAIPERPPRLTGTVDTLPDGGVEIAYTLDAPWKLVKQILWDTAFPVTGAAPHAAGFGRVDRAFVNAQFGRYGQVDATLFDAKVID